MYLKLPSVSLLYFSIRLKIISIRAKITKELMRYFARIKVEGNHEP